MVLLIVLNRKRLNNVYSVNSMYAWLIENQTALTMLLVGKGFSAMYSDDSLFFPCS